MLQVVVTVVDAEAPAITCPNNATGVTGEGLPYGE